MTLTPDEWETELESCEQVAARDTIPAPPPTEPTNERPVVDHACEYCGGLFDHAETCQNFGVFP